MSIRYQSGGVPPPVVPPPDDAIHESPPPTTPRSSQHFMRHTTLGKSAAALAVAVMLVMASAGGATATVSSVDTSGSDATTSTSQVQSGTVIQMNNTSQSHVYQVIATNATDDPVTKVVDDGTVVAENASMTNVSVGSEGSHFNATIAETALVDTEHTIGENVTVEFQAFNNSSADDYDVNTTAYLEFDNSTTVENIDDSDVDAEDVVTITNDTGPFGLTLGLLGETTADVETDDREVNGSNTDVIIALSNESALDMFDDGVTDASAGDKLSSLFSGTRTVATVSDGDETVAVPVFYEEAPDDVDEDTTYAVYKEYGGTQSLVVNLGDSFEDSDDVSVTAIGSAGTTTMISQYLSAGVQDIGGAFGSLAPIVAVPAMAGRRNGRAEV